MPEDQVTTEVVEQSAKLTTFGNVQNDLASFETNQAATQQAAETVLENTSTETTETTQTQESVDSTNEVESNTSNFSFGENAIAENTTQQSVTATLPTFNIDEELKKIDRKELLKKAGVSQFAIEIDEHLAMGGKAEDFLNAKAIDYSKVSDEDLVKSSLKKEYPDFSKEDIDELYLAKYKDIDSEVEYEKKRAEIQLRADAFKLRQTKIEQQQKFKIPDTPVLHTDEAYEQWKEQQKTQSELNDQGKQWFLQHEATKALNESKKVTISLGDDVPPFNFNVDRPDLITQTLTDDGSNWNKLLSTKTGEPDVAKRQLITLFAYNPQQFVKDIFKYGMQLGERKLVADGQNAVKPQAIIAPIDQNATPTYKTGKYGG